jgi:large-conductance mechanosensitive channel
MQDARQTEPQSLTLDLSHVAQYTTVSVKNREGSMDTTTSGVEQFTVRRIACGIAVGLALYKVIASLVEDIVLPPLGRLLGNADFANLFVSLSGKTFYSLAEAKAVGAATLNYGLFLQTMLSFVVVALLVVFLTRRRH